MKSINNKIKYIFGNRAVEKLAYELSMANCVKCGVLAANGCGKKIKLIKKALSNIEYEILNNKGNINCQIITDIIIQKSIKSLIILGDSELIKNGYEIQKQVDKTTEENLKIIILARGNIDCNIFKYIGSQKTVIISDNRMVNKNDRVIILNNAINTLYSILLDCCNNCSYLAIPSHIAAFNKILKCLDNESKNKIKKNQLIELNRAIIEASIGLCSEEKKLDNTISNNEYEIENDAQSATQIIRKSYNNKSMEMFIMHLECSNNELFVDNDCSGINGKIEQLLKKINDICKKHKIELNT